MAKRGNGEGSIRRHSKGGWEARFTGRDGKQHSLYGKTRAEAAAKLTKSLRDVQRGINPAPDRMTVAQYLREWLEMKKLDVRESTWVRYEALSRLHIIPELGRIPLTQLGPQDLNRLYAVAAKKGLSTTTAHYLHRTLHAALHDAMRADLIARNVADLDQTPKIAEYIANPYTPEQARAFLHAIAHDRFHALYLIAVTTGLREGELLALTWDMVDLDNAVLNVRATHARIRRHWVINRPKTKAGIRSIAINDACVHALRVHRVRLNQERLRLGGAWENPALVFPNEAGQRIAGPTFYRGRFLRLLRESGLPPTRFHDLRHTVGTLLMLLKVPTKIISAILGHSSTTITREFYQHLLPGMQREAMDALEQLLGLAIPSEEDTTGTP